MRYGVVGAVFAALVVVQTWPQLTHFDSAVLGAPGDVPNGIRVWWALHAQHGNPFTTAHDFFIDAPDGVPVDRAAYIANGLFQGFWWFGGLLIGWISAYNLFNLLAFVTSGVGAFVLFDRLRFGVLPALFGAYVFAFNPNHIEKVYSSAPLAATGVLPLILLALLAQRRTQSSRASLVVGALLLVGFYLDSYIGLLCLWIVLVFVAVSLVMPPVGLTRLALLRSYYLASLIWVIGMIPAAFGWLQNTQSVAGLSASRSAALPGGFASVQLFLLPGPRNPWIGGPMRSWLHSHLAWEGTMFVGYTTMLLALVGVAIAIVKLRRRTLAREARLLVVFAVALILASLWAALPPGSSIGPVPVPVPQQLLFHLTTLFRVFARFGTLIGLGVVILAVFALANLGTRRVVQLCSVVALVLVAFELYVPTPKLVSVQQDVTAITTRQIGASLSGTPVLLSLVHPPAYVTWLSHQSAGIAVDYPRPDNPDGRWEWKDLFYQTLHGHPLWQVTSTSIADQDTTGFRHRAENLAAPLTPLILKASGVRYVVVHQGRYRALHEAVPQPQCGLRLTKEFRASQVAVYSVTVSGNFAFTAEGEGFDSIANKELWPESEGLHWMGDSGEFSIYWPKSDDVIISAQAVSLNEPRRLEVVDARNHVVGGWEIAPTSTTFDIPLHVKAGLNRFLFLPTPGADVRGFGDGRRVSVAMSQLQVKSANAGSPLATLQSATGCKS